MKKIYSFFTIAVIFIAVNTLADLSEMVIIPEGSFRMGDTFSEGGSDELPLHNVYIDTFYLDKYEVSNEKMAEVMQWAFDNGKVSATETRVINIEGNQKILLDLASSSSQISFINGNTFIVASGKTNFPCMEITWYGTCAYNNYKSEMEELEPCYDLSDWSCNWSSNGYRLPTEAEWEKAARGGVAAMRFQWADTNIITHSRANYYSTNLFSYDVSPTSGYNPDYNTGVEPYTSPVGSFVPNNYGVYDMTGNLAEWINDYWDLSGWYSKAGATNDNTRGPTNGYLHVVRDGTWYNFVPDIRCADRGYNDPAGSWKGCGLRSARAIPEPVTICYLSFIIYYLLIKRQNNAINCCTLDI